MIAAALTFGAGCGFISGTIFGLWLCLGGREMEKTLKQELQEMDDAGCSIYEIIDKLGGRSTESSLRTQIHQYRRRKLAGFGVETRTEAVRDPRHYIRMDGVTMVETRPGSGHYMARESLEALRR